MVSMPNCDPYLEVTPIFLPIKIWLMNMKIKGFPLDTHVINTMETHCLFRF